MKKSARVLTEADVTIFRALRLEGLANNPEAFGASLAREQDHDDKHFREILREDVVIGGFIDDKLVGMDGLRGNHHPKLAHKCHLWGVYVTEAHRGTGIAEIIVDAVTARAQAHYKIIHARVVSTNGGARRFFDRIGFKLYGVERRAIKVGSEYFDEEMRAKFLVV